MYTTRSLYISSHHTYGTATVCRKLLKSGKAAKTLGLGKTVYGNTIFLLKKLYITV